MLIPFITEHYTAHRTHGGYVVKCAGVIIPGGSFTGPDAFNHAANRCYQLNRARNL